MSQSCDSSIASFHDVLKYAYKEIASKSDLFFGVDRDLEDLPEKRKRYPPSRFESALEQIQQREASKIPSTVSLGYGEACQGSLSKIIAYLQHGSNIPHELRLNENSSFLDIGSGYGKAVFHAKIQGNVKKSVGIEYCHKRHQISNEIFENLKNNIDLTGVHFVQGDASQYREFQATHIYTFDYVFSEETHRAILPAIEETNFHVLVSWCSPRKLAKFGFGNKHPVQLVHKQSCLTTGKQNFTAYFYTRY